MRILKKISVLLCAFFLFLALPSCGGGAALTVIQGEDASYVLYGTPFAVNKIEVLDPNGATLATILPDYQLDEPWMGEDTQSYGVTVARINSDEHEDIAIMCDRTVDAQRYLFYFSDGEGGYELQGELSSLVCPSFGETPGEISTSTNERFDTPTPPNEPPIYELRSEKMIYKWNEKGRLELERCIRFSYFSDTDIYLYATLLPDEFSDEGMSPSQELWIYPDRLADFGLEPLG